MRIIISIVFLFLMLQSNAQTDTQDIKLTFDLGITRGKNIYLWPIVRKTDNEREKNLQIAFSLYQKKDNLADTINHRHLLPFYWSDRTTEKKDLRLFTSFYPSIFHFQENKGKQTTSYRFLELAPDIDLIEFSKSKDGKYLKNNLLFFLWYKNDRLNDKSHLVVFPLYWAFSSPERKFNTIIPFYIYGSYRFKTNKYLAVTPLFWKFKYDTSGTRTMFLPIYFHSNITKNNMRVRKTAILPVFWSYRSNLYENKLFFPFYRVYKNKAYQKRYIFPLYWSYKTTQKDEIRKTFFPFLWYSKNNFYQNFTLFPLFSEGHSKDRRVSNLTITPFYGRSLTRNSKSYWLLPFLRHSESYTNYENSPSDTFFSTYVFPSYIRTFDTKSNSGRKILFPLYWQYKDPGLDQFTIFPLIWKKESAAQTYFVFMPLFGYGYRDISDASFYAITPLFWHRKFDNKFEQGTGNFLFPIIWQKKSYNRYHQYKAHEVIFPVWWHIVDSSINKTTKILFPLVGSIRSDRYHMFALIPFFSKGESPDLKRKHFSVTPLYWHFSNHEKHSNFLFPVWFHKKTDKRTSNTIFPIWWSTKEGPNRLKLLFPFYLRVLKKDLFNSIDKRVIFPLYWSKIKNKDTSRIFFPLSYSVKNEFRKTYLFLPLFMNSKNHFYKNRITAVTPFFWYIKNPVKKSVTLFPVYFHKSWEKAQHRVTSNLLLPLYYRYNNPNSGFRKTMLTPFIWHERDSQSSAFSIIPIYFHRSLKVDSFRNVRTILLPVYFRKKDAYRNNLTIFPFVYSFKNNRYNSFTFFPLFSSGKNKLNTERHLVITPFFWNIHRNGNRTLSVVPLFNLHTGNTGEKKLSILYFLFRHHTRPGSKEFSFLWPLCEYRKDSVSMAFRIVPLLWFKNTDTSGHKAVLPFFYSSRSNTGKSFNLLWQVYVQKNEKGIVNKNSFLFKSLIVNRYSNHDYEYRFLYKVYSKVKKQGKKEMSVFPFYYAEKDSAAGTYYKSSLLSFYSKLKRAIPQSKYFYEEEKILWFIRIRSNYKSLKAQGLIKGKP